MMAQRISAAIACLFWLFLAAPAVLAHPSAGIVVDADGNVLVADLSRGLIKIDPQGKVTTLQKEAGHWLALDPQGAFSDVDFTKSRHWPRWFKRRTSAGAKPALITDGGSPLVVAPDGNLYYVSSGEQLNPGGHEIARLSPNGHESLFTRDLHKTSEDLGGIKGLALGPDKSLYVTCPKAVYRITRDGKFTPVANPVVVDDCDKHPPSIRDAPSLRGLAVDPRGTVYAAATGCRRVLKITSDAQVTTILKSEAPWSPSGVALHNDDLYVLEHVNANSEAHEDWPPRVRKLDKAGKIATLLDLAAAAPDSPARR
jgi:sugar lactone lactonase YvrE